MKVNSLPCLLLALVFCVSFAACSSKVADENKETVAASGSASDTSVAGGATSGVESDTPESGKITFSITLCGVDISEYSIVIPKDDTGSAKLISEYIVSGVKTLTEKELTVNEDTSAASDFEIVVGSTSRKEAPVLGNDEFIIKCEDNKLYIWYASETSPYHAVTAVLSDFLLGEKAAIGGRIDMAADFEFSGICGEYMIGDNEFNPFE